MQQQAIESKAGYIMRTSTIREEQAMQTLIPRTRGSRKHAAKVPAHKTVKPVDAPKFSADTQRIARLARRLKGAFGASK